MRILQLTPGTGSFYCGTCMRDNTLVVALGNMGHDARMVPLYLPPMLDEESAATDMPLFYGGVNVYLQQKSALFRKAPRWVDNLLDSPAAIRAASKRAGMTQPSDLGDLTLSTLRGEEGNQAKELDKLVEWLAEEGQPDVVCLSNALLMGLARRIREETGAAVVCTLHGEDYFIDDLPEPSRSASWQAIAERAADVDAFIAVSHYYGDTMQRRAKLPADRLHVVYNGIQLEGYGPAPAPPDPPVLGFLSRLCSLKGLETLVDAYIHLRHSDTIKNLKLRIAGSMTAADEPYVAQMRSKLEAAGFAGDTEILPNIDRKEKAAFLQSLSVLSVPATYGESFGLYILEALACGVPVVQPRHAVFPELLAETGGGVLCEPDDPHSLATTIENLLCDPLKAKALGEQGRLIVNERFGMEQMARNVLDCFERAIEHRKSAGRG